MSPENGSKNQKEIFEFRKQIEYLESLDETMFRGWLERALKGITDPLYFGSDEAYEKVMEIFAHGSLLLQQTIGSSIAYLVHAWNGAKDSLAYLEDLIFLVGRLRITHDNAYKRILSWVKQGIFKDVYVDVRHKLEAKDLHLTCLRSIGPQGINDFPLIRVCLDDIGSDPYFGICYRILYEHDASEYLKKYFPMFVRLCMEKKYVFRNQFYYIYKLCKREFSNNVTEILGSLNLKERNFVKESLYEMKDFLGHEFLRMISDSPSVSVPPWLIFELKQYETKRKEGWAEIEHMTLTNGQEENIAKLLKASSSKGRA